MRQPYAALLATQRETASTFIAIRRDLHAHSESGFEETRAVQRYVLPGNGVARPVALRETHPFSHTRTADTAFAVSDQP
jgi:metal-dependent amidase/aminoacylase/carboxypeptidase family protein